MNGSAGSSFLRENINTSLLLMETGWLIPVIRRLSMMKEDLKTLYWLHSEHNRAEDEEQG